MIALVRIALSRPYTFVVLALLLLIIGPLAATQLFSIFTAPGRGEPGYFPGAPFIGAGITIVIAAAVFVYTAWRYDLMHRKPVAQHPHRVDMAPPGQQATPPHANGEDNGK